MYPVPLRPQPVMTMRRTGCKTSQVDEREQAGHEAIARAVASAGTPAVVVEMHRQLGDILHSTLVVRHLRATCTDKVVWAISERYIDTFSQFGQDQLGPHAIAALPELPAWPNDGPFRVAWVTRAKTLPGVRAVGCGVHPWGWACGTIVDAVLSNAGVVETLAVPRRPWLPLHHDDLTFADRFIRDAGLQRGYVALEYTSYSLKTNPISWYQELVRRSPLPVVALASSQEELPAGAIDGRATSFRQAKKLIMRASCFVGCGSGLSVIAASNHCEQPVIELVTSSLSMPVLGYRPADRRYRNLHGESPKQVAAAIDDIGHS